MLIGKGRFSGAGGHTLAGSFTLTRQSNGVLMETSPDFFFDGAPEPDWALFRGIPKDCSDPKVQEIAEVTRFGNMPGGIVPVRGRQVGLILDSVDLNANDTIFLWCFSVPFILGFGPIEKINS